MTLKEKVAIEIIKNLHNRGFEAYFAGGCVRDRLRGVEPKDFDIATSAAPEAVQKIFRAYGSTKTQELLLMQIFSL